MTWPQGAIRLTSYPELERCVQAFAQGRLNLLFLLGPPGIQKSRSLRAAVGPRAAWIDGSMTSFGLYRELYRHQNELLVLDDVDGLYRDRAAVRLLKCVCQTDPAKRVAWHSDAAALRRDGIPRSFATRSRLAIIANEVSSLNANVRAQRRPMSRWSATWEVGVSLERTLCGLTGHGSDRTDRSAPSAESFVRSDASLDEDRQFCQLKRSTSREGTAKVKTNRLWHSVFDVKVGTQP